MKLHFDSFSENNHTIEGVWVTYGAVVDSLKFKLNNNCLHKTYEHAGFKTVNSVSNERYISMLDTKVTSYLCKFLYTLIFTFLETYMGTHRLRRRYLAQAGAAGALEARRGGGMRIPP